MSKIKDPDYRRQLSTLWLKIADRIQQDEDFAAWLFEGTDFSPANKTGRTKKPGTQEPSEEREEPVQTKLPDIFAIYLEAGAEGLREQLDRVESTILKKLVSENGLDPAGKVRRWRVQPKIRDFLIEAVAKHMSKGKAFQG